MKQEEIKKAFPLLKTRADVAAILEIEDRSLRYFLFKRRPENLYTTFSIPKYNGKLRQIAAPQNELKQIQRKLAYVLSCIYTPKVCAYGFISGKNHINNASQHVQNSIVFNIDLKDFFSQIHFGRVRGMLMKPPYSIGVEAATTIAQIACYNGVLPQGAPSSPVLTNMICAPLDNSLLRLAKETGCVYTRYADDISFSTHKKQFPVSIAVQNGSEIQLGAKLQKTLAQHSFVVNPQKVLMRNHAQHQEVTGLTVNSFPNIRRKNIRNLRSIIHHCETDGLYNAAKAYCKKGLCNNPAILDAVDNPEEQGTVEAWFVQVLKGKINYIKQVKGDKDMTYLSFAQRLNNVAKQDIFDVSALHFWETLAEENTCILQYNEGDNFEQGSAFFLSGIGLVTSYHVIENGIFYRAYISSKYDEESFAVVGKDARCKSLDPDIDYAFFDVPHPIPGKKGFLLGDSSKLHVGDQIIIIGYPSHNKGNSPNIQSCSITGKKEYMGADFYTVSGRVVHGASGGVVLNTKFEAVGIIKGGVETLRDDEDSSNINQGFVPIHLAIDHWMKK